MPILKFGSGIQGWLEGFRYRIPIDIDHTKIDSDLSNFPVAVKLSGSSFSDVFDEVGDNYRKIAVTLDDGETRLFTNVQKWDSGSGVGWLTVGVPSVSSSADTRLFLYFYKYADNQEWYQGDLSDLNDDFSGDDGDDPDFLKWRVMDGSPSIQSNTLSVSVSSSSRRDRILFKHKLHGDFDIRVKGHLNNSPSTNWWVMNLVLYFFDQSGHWCYVGRGYDSSIGSQWMRSRYNKGTSTTLDYDTVTDTDFTLRLVREGKNIYFYYKTDGSWVSLSSVEMYSDTVCVSLELSCGSGYPSVSGYFDDFEIYSADRVTGYVGRPGSYMASGVFDNDVISSTSMVDSKDLKLFLEKSSNFGSQGLVADGQYFYWGKNNGTGVNGTIYKFDYNGSDITSFDGPPHCAGGDVFETNNTLLFSSGGSEDYEVWEISKSGTHLRTWDLKNVDYGTGGLVAFKEGNTIFAFTSERTSPYAFKVREISLTGDGTFTLGKVWSHSGLGVPQGLEYVDGRLLLLADTDSEATIHELLLRDDGSIDEVSYKTGITTESEGLAWDGEFFYFGTYNTGKIYQFSDVTDLHDFKINTDYVLDELLVDHEGRRVLTKSATNGPLETSTDFAGGQDFDGSSDYITMGNPSDILDVVGDSDFTVEAIAKTTDTSTWSVIYAARDSSTTGIISFRKDSSNHLRLWKQDDDGDDIQPISTGTIADGNDHYLVGVLDGTSATLYIDESQDGTDSNASCGSAAVPSDGHIIGRKGSDQSTDYWDGVISFLRISRVARSEAWLKATKKGLFNDLISGVGAKQSTTEYLENLALNLLASTYATQNLSLDLEASTAEHTSLEDLTLDLSAGKIAVEDLGLDLSAQYITALQDLVLDLEVWGQEAEDLSMWLGAGIFASEDLTLDLYTQYEGLQDLLLDLTTSATAYQFLTLFLLASKVATEDLPLGLRTISQAVENLILSLYASAYSLQDLMTYLTATDGVVLKDLLLDLYISDGQILKDLRLDLVVSTPVPIFKGLYFQRSSNILREV